MNTRPLVAYQAKQQKISLLVTSSHAAVAAGGEEVDSGGIAFHYSKQGIFNTIAWSNHGLTYALVSSLPGSGRQSCLVCHESMETAIISALFVDAAFGPFQSPPVVQSIGSLASGPGRGSKQRALSEVWLELYQGVT